MKLKSVEIYGFKSFAGKSKLQFNKNISAIVGPNGSGKSNISDAVRWVLGEQSAKSLRGASMADVIFSGTDEKKQMNMARVTLNLDNSDKALDIDFNEVSITRKVFRNGDSEYLINKAPVRLKDIKELFLDTGIGKDGYSIIGQGRIDNILNGKSEDRRYLFEEASGIAKYKFKKQEAERRLIKNDEALKTIRSEMKIKEQEVNILEQQANNARDGVKLTKELELLELSYLKNNLNKIDSSIGNLNSEKESFSQDLDQIVKRLNYLVSKNEPQVKMIEDLEKKIRSKEQDKVKEDKLISNLKSDNSVLEERIKFSSADLERIIKDKESRSKRYESNLNKIEDYQAKVVDLNKTISENENKLSMKKESIGEIDKKLKDYIESISSLESSIETSKSKLSDMNVSKLTKDNLDRSNSENLERISISIQSLTETINNDKLSLKEKESRVAKIDEKIKNNISKIEEYSSKRGALSKEIDRLNLDLDAHSQNFYKLKSRKDVLFSVFKSYEGYYKPIQNLLKIRDANKEIDKKIVGVLADLVSIEDKYKTALDVTLGSSLQNIVVENEQDGKDLINFIKRQNLGRITFLPINKIQGKKYSVSHPLVIDSLNNLVTNSERLDGIIDNFLSRTLLVDTMDNAIKVSREIKGFRIVTLEGEIINSWGSMVGGSFAKKDSASLINRQEELNDLDREIANIVNYGKNLKAKLKSSQDNLDQIYNELNKIDLDNGRLSSEKSSVLGDIKEIKAKVSINELTVLESKKQVEDLKANITQEDYSSIGDLEKDISEKLAKLNDLKAERNSFLDEKIEAEKNEILIKSNLEGYARDLLISEDNLGQLMNDNENILSQNRNDDRFISQLEKEIDQINQKKESNMQIIDQNSSKEDIIQEQIDTLIKELDTLKLESSKELKEIDLLKDQKSDLDKSLFQIDVKLESEGTKKEELINEHLDSYEIEKQDLLNSLRDLKEVKVTRKDIVDVKNKLSKIGFFNFASIEEYKLEKEQFDFIKGQFDDLTETREDIIKMIKSLEKDMKHQFIESFQKINEKFSKVFSVMFNGGEASLILDGDDILTAGIDIIAKPPGKKLKSLALLSGGEKALTAVALLFAIFEINPAPFCILDEIDAALDEANIKRYITYLKSLVDKTQFIIITHRKVTMEMADILYGVTMEEKGISKVITLALDEYKEE